MYTVRNNLIVKYDFSHNKIFKVGGIELVRPDMWLHSHGDETTHTKFMDNKNKLETNPQIATVVVTNKNSKLVAGDIVFLHYMAYEWHETFIYKDEECAMIDGDYVLFKIENNEYKMIDGYLAEQIIESEIRLDSGIFINVEEKPKAVEVKLTHVPNNSKYYVGQRVVTVDEKNYLITIDGNKKFVYLKETEIVAFFDEK